MDLTFEKVLKVAQAMETANKDVKDLQAQHSETSISMRVQKMSVKHEDSQSRACYRCGSLQHLANECRFISENVTIVGNKDTNKNVDQKVPQGNKVTKGKKIQHIQHTM